MQKMIELKDGVKVDVNISDRDAIEISGNKVVESSLSNIQGLLKKVVQPVCNTYQELSKDMNIDSAKVTIGIKIDVEGNFILASSGIETHLLIKRVTFSALVL